MTVRIVTDSASGINDADCQRFAITRVSLLVVEDGRVVPERELQSAEFYSRLAAASDLPKTSQPSPEDFAEAFRLLVAEGADVLAITISAGMSGTLQSATLAAESVVSDFPGSRIQILDSQSNSLQEGFAVLSAAEAASQGASYDDCRKAAEATIRRTRFLFTPRSLEYLRRGGRISGASALLGSVLKIAPILTADHGTTAVASVARTRRSAYKRMASLMRADVERCGLKRAVVQYIADEQGAARFAAEYVEPISKRPVPLVPIHPVVGLHVGPAAGVVYETAEPLR